MPIVIKPKSIKSFTNKGKDKIGGGGMDIGNPPKKKTKKMMGGTMKKPVMAKKGKMNKLNPGLKVYLAKKKKTKKKK